VFTIHGAGYATACPGGMRLDSIVARAKQLLSITPASAPSVPATSQKEDEMKIIAPFGNDDKAVIGPGIGYLFSDYGTYLHFCNVWGFNPNAAQVVGDAGMGAPAARQLFYKIVALHASAAPAQLSAATVTAAVTAALAGASIPATVDTAAIVRAVEASLADDFARVNANVDEIPLGFTITAK